MNWAHWLLWGFAATVLMTTLMTGSQAARLTRINLPYMIGTIFTPNRDRAKVIGFFLHLLNGWAISLLYLLGFQALGVARWWIGALFGLLHGAFVLTVGMTLMPGLHPRMASEHQGPTVARQLEPPGFLALNYGAPTPAFLLAAHVLFGAFLGGLYHA